MITLLDLALSLGGKPTQIPQTATPVADEFFGGLAQLQESGANQSDKYVSADEEDNTVLVVCKE